jgi:predicted kinase
MERIKRIRNPYQDRINALNARDMDEALKIDNFLYKKREPIPDDINNQRFPMTDILPPNVLKPEDLSMKDLLDQVQIQTILNNNIAPFVKKEIKSEVTQEMIKQFQYESSQPVQIGDKFYKYKPPTIDIDLTDVPPPFPSETEYKNQIRSLYNDELKIGRDLERQRVDLVTEIQRKEDQYNDGRISLAEFQAAKRQYENSMIDVSDATRENESNLSSLSLDYDLYDEYKLEYDTKKDLIEKENKKQLDTYEDELRSRNTGMEVARAEGESDEDYAQRMIDTAQVTVDPAQVETQAKLFLYNSVKDLMNELTPTYKSEAILNTIVQAGGYEKLQPIKDQWPAVKKLLIETFGNVGRVENTDSVAQVMYNSTLKPFVRPAGPTPPSSTTLSTKPTVSSSNVRPPYVYSRTEVPAPPPNTVLKTSIYNPRGISLKPASYADPRSLKEQQKKEDIYNRALLRKQQLLSNLSAKKEREIQREFLKAERKRAENPQFELVEPAVTPIDIAYYLKSNVRPYPTDIVLKTPALERVGRRIPAEVGLKDPRFVSPRVSQRSPAPVMKTRARDILARMKAEIPPEVSLQTTYINPRINKLDTLKKRTSDDDEQDWGEVGLPNAFEAESARLSALQAEPTSPRTNRFEQTSFMPMSTFRHKELRDMLEQMGETFKTGNSEASKKSNYDKLISLDAIPPRATFIPRDEFLQLTILEMAQYLDANEMKGTRGGTAFEKLGRADARPKLIKQYDSYMTKMAGRGFKSEHIRNIKDEFAIIDGEIQAGNNNPQLMRDARKLLKQMVQQKMVTIYEAQTHMKHLRKINKI